MYALLGAAGFLGGLMRMSAAQALILMEMTQAPAQLPFLMLTLVLSKEARDVMASNTRDRTLYLVETGQVLQQALDTHRDLAAFPVTLPPLSDKVPGDFVGMISRKNIALLLEEHGLEIVNAEGFNYDSG
ncbi:uncharacterized protein HaLaN_21472, partial [Haematococcus lacustris]